MRRSQRSHSQSISAGRARALAAGALVALLGGIGLIVTSSGSHHVAEQAAPEPVGGSPTATVAAPAFFRYGWLRRLPKDFIGEKHRVMVKRSPTGSSNVEWCEWEERPGPLPRQDDGEFPAGVRDSSSG